MICNYYYFKDIGYKFECNSIEPYACKKCHNISMMAYDLDDFVI